MNTENTTTYPDRKSWLDDRRKWVGASDVPSILGPGVLGVTPFKSRFELWAEKVGVADPEEPTGDRAEAMEWGVRLERTIGYSYAERKKIDIIFPEPYTVWHCGDAPLAATLDATIGHQQPGRPGVLQIKNVGSYNAKEWADGPPLIYECQTQAEMLCSGHDWATLAALIGGNKLRAFDLEFHEAFCDGLKKAARDFWALVENKIAPDVDASDSCRRALQRLHPDDDGSEVDLDAGYIPVAALITSEKAKKKAAETEIKLAENQLRAAIGSATFARLPDGQRISLKTTQKKGYEVKPTSFRTLRIPKVKV